VHYKGTEDEIDLKSFRMGNDYASAFAQGLHLSKAKKVNLADNNLNDIGSYNIVQGINRNLKEMDLS
jgi:hypothetical protein